MKPKDRAALIIASGLIAWGLVMMVSLAWRNKSMSEGGSEIFMAVATGLCTALGAYFARNGNGKPPQ